ncbi:hypothetical protein [Candidatus Poriferisocius sp.]|uniref:hypothetical protein n=1 Tax=Candidatus Poriferisocius sp. TaxID=3101276 RepID=UPI003B5C5062
MGDRGWNSVVAAALSRASGRLTSERGSISVVAAAMVGVLAMAIGLMGQLGADAVRRARVTAVADVVAMAAAAEPHTATTVAAANGATVVSSIREDFQTEVVVRLGAATAVARAEYRPEGWWQCHRDSANDPVHFESCPSTPVG